MNKKFFDPERCPYEQLKEHEGSAIIFVEPADETTDKWQTPRIRYMHEGKMYYSIIDEKQPTLFAPSCFSYKYGGSKKVFHTKDKTIRGMKEWDERTPREKIVYIEFH